MRASRLGFETSHTAAPQRVGVGARWSRRCYRDRESVGGSLLVNERLSCWDEVLGTMPEATLAVRRAAFRQLLSGRAVAIEEVAADAGLGDC